MNCLRSFATENARGSRKVCENKDFCKVITPSEDTITENRKD